MTNPGQRTPRLTRKGKMTRARILAAAARLMFEHGVAGTSTEDVRHAAEVSSSQLYHYFSDKQALVRAVIAYQTEAVLAAQQPVLSRLDSFEALQAWRDLLVGLQRERDCQGGCPLGSLASELADADTQCRAELAAGFTRWHAAIRDGLHAMRQRGDLTPACDPDQMALAILAAVEGGLLLTQTYRDPAPLEAALDAAFAYLRSYQRT